RLSPWWPVGPSRLGLRRAPIHGCVGPPNKREHLRRRSGRPSRTLGAQPPPPPPELL
ncbi:unnamed protein product, partial [Amoebophrya sp. A120]